MQAGRSFWLVALLVAAGCADDGGRGASPVELPGPGTPLRDGFEVPAGTRLLGAVGPGGAVGGTGWAAQFFVEGDGRATLVELVEELEDRGLQLRGGCYPQEESGYAKYCTIGASREVDGFVRERVDVTLLRSVADADQGYASHLWIAYARWPAGTREARYQGQRPFRGLGAFPEPAPPPPIPAVDEPVPQSPYTEDQVFRVVPGTRVTSPVRTLDICNGGFEAHLQVTGDLDAVVEETRRRFEELRNVDDTSVEDGGGDGHDTLTVVGEGDASARMEVTVGDGDEPTWATVSYCTD
jgi:hypothetical protein